MATEKDLQHASSAKRKGKEIAMTVTKKTKDENLERSKSEVDARDIPESSSRKESSSESEIEDEEEGLDEWEKEARRMFPPREETNGWRPWTIQESTILEMEYMAAMLDFVPFTGELTEEELGPEVEFDMQYVEEDDTDEVVPDPQITEYGIEEQDSAQPPHEPQGTDQADGAAMADALVVAADPSSSSINPTK